MEGELLTLTAAGMFGHKSKGHTRNKLRDKKNQFLTKLDKISLSSNPQLTSAAAKVKVDDKAAQDDPTKPPCPTTYNPFAMTRGKVEPLTKLRGYYSEFNYYMASSKINKRKADSVNSPDTYFAAVSETILYTLLI